MCNIQDIFNEQKQNKSSYDRYLTHHRRDGRKVISLKKVLRGSMNPQMRSIQKEGSRLRDIMRVKRW